MLRWILGFNPRMTMREVPPRRKAGYEGYKREEVDNEIVGLNLTQTVA